MAAQFVLLVSSGRLRREVPVGDETLVLGRGPTSNLRLPDDYCSREHARILVKGDDLVVEDVGSRNGIYVNADRVVIERRLVDGDEIRMGRTVITVRRAVRPTTRSGSSSDSLSDTNSKELGAEGAEFVGPALELGFALEKLIAVSGMGMLYEARDVKTDRPVAFKILRPDRATEANVARAVEEAKSLSRIHHENIVRILTTGRMKNGESFLVMDYVRGLTATQLGKAGRLWIPEALEIASHTCGALEIVHQRGMVHRDIKPSNVMVEEDSFRTVLIDFSLALTEAGGLASAPAGTIIFCAPEQVQPQSPVDAMSPKVDIYGLGGTLYFMLTGVHPFRGSSTLEIQEKKLGEPLPKVEDRLGARAIPELDELIHQCMQPSPADRPSDIRDVKRAIDKARLRYPKPRYSDENKMATPSPVRKRRV